MNGYTIEDVTDPNDPTKVLIPAGRLLDSFAQVTDDGKTAAGCWIYTGSFTEAGNQMARRDATDQADAGVAPRLVLASQSPHSLQPCVRRPAGQALGCA